MLPKSQAQLAWMNSPEGRKALGNKVVEQANQSSVDLKLPEHVQPIKPLKLIKPLRRRHK